MLIAALISSGIVLGLGTMAMVRGGGWVTAFGLSGLLLGVGPFFLFFQLPPFLLFLFLIVPVHHRMSLTSLRSRALAIAGPMFGCCAVTGWFVWDDQRELARFRTQYPYESVEERLPRPSVTVAALTQEARRSLDDVERRLEKVSTSDLRPNESLRSSVLKQLHEDTLRTFVSSPGFGQMRLAFRPSRFWLNYRLRRNPPIEQPRPPMLSAGVGENEPWKLLPPEPELEEIHQESVIDFVNPTGFGYVKDRKHVAGFQPHQFGETPRGGRTVASVELLGLLLHPEPVVYVSPHLPNMEELRGAPTRPLDRFEAAGLEAIQRGEDLFVGETPTGVRMLGAIRNASQCLQCHQGNRGDLLGAFSYRLEPSAK
jgi:hypothetical protein